MHATRRDSAVLAHVILSCWLSLHHCHYARHTTLLVCGGRGGACQLGRCHLEVAAKQSIGSPELPISCPEALHISAGRPGLPRGAKQPRRRAKAHAHDATSTHAGDLNLRRDLHGDAFRERATLSTRRLARRVAREDGPNSKQQCVLQLVPGVGLPFILRPSQRLCGHRHGSTRAPPRRRGRP